MAFTTLAVGHLNILTITFVPILDWAGDRFRRASDHALRRGIAPWQERGAALTKAMVFTGQGIFTGAFTTAGAFLAMAFTDFKGIQEMGIICGGGLMVCLIPMMTLLPVLLLRGRQNIIDHRRGRAEASRRQYRKFVVETSGRGAGDHDCAVRHCGNADRQGVVRLQHSEHAEHGLPSVRTEEKLIHSAGQSLLYGAVIADTPQQAVRLEEQLTNLTSVASVQSMANYFVEDPTEQIAANRRSQTATSSR